ncbi:MAG: hypothetical protein ABSE73_22540 [Planctomycetota bacterium]
MTRLIIPLVVLAVQCAVTVCAEPPNLVPNGDFSQVTNGKPERWETSGDGKTVAQTLTVEREADGKPFAKLACTRCEKVSPSSHAMLAQIGGAQLGKGKLYEFSCRLRAEGLASRTVGIAIQDTKGWTNVGLQDQAAVGETWKEHKRFFHARQDCGASGRLQIWFSEPGTLCVAGVRISECAAQEVEFTHVVPPGTGKNLVPNGSFELGACGWSSLGQGAGWGNLEKLHGTIEEGAATHGRAFLRIPLGGEHTPLLCFDYYEPVVRRELRPLAAGTGWIALEKNTAYTLSCDMRSSVDGTPAILGIRGEDPGSWPHDYSSDVSLTKEWKRYSFTFRPKERYGFVLAGPALKEEQRVDVDMDAVQLEKGAQATPYQLRSELELALQVPQPGGVFSAGQPASVYVAGFNGGAAAARATVKFTVTDFEDKPVEWVAQELQLQPGAAVRQEVKIPAEWLGFYRVRAAAEGSATPFADVRLAIVPPRTADDSVCGINHAFAAPGLIELASKAGVTWFRDWSLKWQHIEPAPGEWHWEVGDAQLNRVLAKGLKVLPLLPPFPSADWSSDAPADLPAKGYPGVRLKQAWGPKDPGQLGAFIERAVTRYKDRIHVWEFLNEPVYTDYALPADHANKYHGKHYTFADYVALFQTAAAAMRKSDPGCKVMGGIAGGPREGTKEVIAAGILKLADIINLHIYPGTRAPETYAAEMDALLANMDANGGRKPIWMTEFSYYGADSLPRQPFFPAPDSWSEERLLENEQQCADYTLRFYIVMLAHGVEKIFIHSGASGRVNEPNFECALFDYGGAPRKLFPALAVFTELLGPAPAFAGWRDFAGAGHGAAFETGKQCVLIFWREEGGTASAVGVRGAEGLSWLNTMGRKMPAQAPGGAELSPSPVYLLGPAGKAKELLTATELRIEK